MFINPQIFKEVYRNLEPDRSMIDEAVKTGERLKQLGVIKPSEEKK